MNAPLLLLALAAGLLPVPKAWAHSPTPRTVIHQMQKRLPLPRVDSQMTVEFVHSGLEEGRLSVEGDFQAEGPDRIRLTVRMPAGRRVQIRNGSRRLTLEGEWQVAQSNQLLDVPLDFWLFEAPSSILEPSRLEQRLQALGIPMEEVALDRADRRVCWRIGGESPDRPGLWIDKDLLYPLQLRVPHAGWPGSQLVIRYSDWRSRGAWAWPQEIAIDRDGQPTWRLVWPEEKRLHLDGAPLPEALFDAEGMAVQIPIRPAGESAWLPDLFEPAAKDSDSPLEGPSSPADSERAMEEFEKRFNMGDNGR